MMVFYGDLFGNPFGHLLSPPRKAKERPVNAAEIYDKTLDTVREQFLIADANFSARTMDSWLQEVERMLNRTKADLMTGTINDPPKEWD